MTDSDRKYMRRVAARVIGILTFLIIEIEVPGSWDWGRAFAIILMAMIVGVVSYFLLWLAELGDRK